MFIIAPHQGVGNEEIERNIGASTLGIADGVPSATPFGA